MQTRSATREDVPALAALERSTFGDDAYPAVFLRQAIDLWSDLVRVAEDGGTLAGYVLAAPAFPPQEAWILGLAVDVGARGKGIGRQLTASVLDRLTGGGVRCVRLTVHPDNRPAIALYRSFGFRLQEGEASYFGPGQPRVRMLLRTAPLP